MVTIMVVVWKELCGDSSEVLHLCSAEKKKRDNIRVDINDGRILSFG